MDHKPVKTNKVGGSPFKGVLGWIDDRLPLFRMFKHEYLDFQVPKSLNYFWSFGGILMFCLLGLIVSGIVLGMHYKPDADDAFNSVEHIMRDVNFGWDALIDEVFYEDNRSLVHNTIRDARLNLEEFQEVKLPPAEQLTAQYMEACDAITK